MGRLNLNRNLSFSLPLMHCDFSGVSAKLRDIANKNDHVDHVVQYLLGLMGDTTDDWLGKASDGRFALASYHLGFSRYADEPEAALRHLKRVAFQADENLADFPEQFEVRLRQYDDPKEIVSEEFFNKIRNKALARIMKIEHEQAEIERELAERRAREETQQDMLSYLSHTLTNTLAGGPAAARQALRLLEGEVHEHKAIQNIAAMLTTFLFAQQLLQTFKQYIADPEALRRNWQADREGDATMRQVLALSVRQSLSQLILSSNHLSSLQRLLPSWEEDAVNELQKSFIDEMIPAEADAAGSDTILEWVRERFGMLRVSIDPAAELYFKSNSTRFTFFYSSFSELALNALKYSDGSEPIKIVWQKSEGHYALSVENTWTEDSLRSSEGSGRGHLFLFRMAELLGARFETRREANRFIAELRFPAELLREAP